MSTSQFSNYVVWKQKEIGKVHERSNYTSDECGVMTSDVVVVVMVVVVVVECVVVVEFVVVVAVVVATASNKKPPWY